MSGWKIADFEKKLSAERIPSDSSGVALRVHLTSDVDGGNDTVITLSATRDADGTLVLRFPDGRTRRAVVSRDGKRRWVTALGHTFVANELVARRGAIDLHSSLEAPMPGKVTRVLVAVGDRVKKGQTLLAVEAMKMEHAIKSPKDGVIESIRAALGELVSPGTPLCTVGDPSPEATP